MTPRAIAYWLSGDGNFHQGNGVTRIDTFSFTIEEANRLRGILKTKFSIDSTLNLEKGLPVIRIAKNSMPLLQDLVKPTIPPMMAYRAGL